eukprot:scaffold3079_cov119-Cylindrotheca_fusiformis.AAC.21
MFQQNSNRFFPLQLHELHELVDVLRFFRCDTQTKLDHRRGRSLAAYRLSNSLFPHHSRIRSISTKYIRQAVERGQCSNSNSPNGCQPLESRLPYSLLLLLQKVKLQKNTKITVRWKGAGTICTSGISLHALLLFRDEDGRVKRKHGRSV